MFGIDFNEDLPAMGGLFFEHIIVLFMFEVFQINVLAQPYQKEIYWLIF